MRKFPALVATSSLRSFTEGHSNPTVPLPDSRTTMSKSFKHEPLWAKASKVCRINQDDIAMAKQLGLKPRTLMKNHPSPSQQWKLPVKQWIHQLHEKRFGPKNTGAGSRLTNPGPRPPAEPNPLMEPQAVILFDRTPPPPDLDDCPF